MGRRRNVPGLGLFVVGTAMEAVMRRVSCNLYEFDPPDSEQALEVALAAPSRDCPDLAALLAACGASALAGRPPPADWARWGQITAHLHRFAAVAVPDPTQLRAAVLLRDDWDDVELGIALDSVLVWYHWSTSA
jgi:hypothetical protein